MITIEGVAIKAQDGTVHSMRRPARHCDVIRKITRLGLDIMDTVNQGFITNEGQFVDRETAYVIAREASQITRRRPELKMEELYSEDMW